MSEMLKDACDASRSNPAYQPANGTTHCSEAAASVGSALGCQELNGLCANDQYARIKANASGKWSRVSSLDATVQALDDAFAVGILPSNRIMDGLDAETGKPIWATHGHIVVIYPVGRQWSGSFQRDVCVCSNVGKTVGVMKTSEAFPVASGECEYYAWSQDATTKTSQ